MTSSIDKLTWRQAAAEDTPLLFALFAASKGEELAPLGLSAQQMQPLLEMQFWARQAGYSQSYPNALDTILCLADGTPVGRHLFERQVFERQVFERQESCYRTIDLAVLPEHRGRGIGEGAVRQIQELAELEGVGMRLRVVEGNPALRLYERLGFRRVSADGISDEMEWLPTRAVAAQPVPATEQRPVPDAQVPLHGGDGLDRSMVIETIFGFLREIGLKVQPGPVVPFGSIEKTFLPGIRMVSGGLQVDIDALLYPGDLLHEAGHVAVMTPANRNSAQPDVTELGEEIAAQAWSYAAALHLGLPPEVVFHEKGYRGKAKGLIEMYANGNGYGVIPGVPLLAWMGMTTPALSPQDPVPSIYPRMLRWVRETAPEEIRVEMGEEVCA